jgi:hypothetical protein
MSTKDLFVIVVLALILFGCGDQPQPPPVPAPPVKWELRLNFNCPDEDAPCEPNPVVLGRYDTKVSCDTRGAEWTKQEANPTGVVSAAICSEVR